MKNLTGPWMRCPHSGFGPWLVTSFAWVTRLCHMRPLGQGVLPECPKEFPDDSLSPLMALLWADRMSGAATCGQGWGECAVAQGDVGRSAGCVPSIAFALRRHRLIADAMEGVIFV